MDRSWRGNKSFVWRHNSRRNWSFDLTWRKQSTAWLLTGKNRIRETARSCFKKSHREKLTVAFTKTFGQIYSQYSVGERVGYWIIVFMGLSIIAYLGLRKKIIQIMQAHWNILDVSREKLKNHSTVIVLIHSIRFFS